MWTGKRGEDFNPRSPCGERPHLPGADGGGEGISIHAPRVGSDGDCTVPYTLWGIFQSTLPVWGATIDASMRPADETISIHAPRVGSDPRLGIDTCRRIYFNPRSPCGERHGNTDAGGRTAHFNPRSPCGERLRPRSFGGDCDIFQPTLPVWGATMIVPSTIAALTISIHAPRVGSDAQKYEVRQNSAISIHAPRVGSDVPLTTPSAYSTKFQSTLPVWGATLRFALQPVHGVDISIHAPRVGSDQGWCECEAKQLAFQSTLPVWGATVLSNGVTFEQDNFNPRSPCGERRPHSLPRYKRDLFQSTLPVWGATAGEAVEGVSVCRISIHAPRVGSDETGRF